MSVLLFLLFLAALVGGIIHTVILSANLGKLNLKPMLSYTPFVAGLLVVWLSFTTVDAGTVGVVTRNGQVNRIFSPGPQWVMPVIESVHAMTTQTLVVKPDEDAASHDLQMVHTQVTLAYHFDAAHMDYIYSQLADSSENSVERKVVVPALLEAIKASTALYDAQALISDRAAVRDHIEGFVKNTLAPYHIIPETVSITDFHFSKDYEQAIEAKVTAQQNAEKAQNILAQVKIEAQQKVAAAEGEAQALKAQKEQITPELLQLRTIEMLSQKWDGKLPESYYGGSAPLPIVDVLKNAGRK